MKTLYSYAAILAFIVAQPHFALADSPEQANAQVGATEIVVSWDCPLDSDSGLRNCPQAFFIYRTPSGTGFPLQRTPVAQAGDPDPGDSVQSFADYSVKPSTTYTYSVCDGQQLSDKSNCANVSATTAAPSNSGGTGNSGGGSGTGSYTPTPPLHPQATPASAQSIALSWENPPNVNKSIAIVSGNTLIATLNPGSTRWVAEGLDPHTIYQYEVCEGPAYQTFSCVAIPGITWGSNPVLQAQRGSGDSVTLTVALDSTVEVDGLKITRQSSADVCQQPKTLPDGSKVCSMGSVGPTGVLQVGVDSQQVVVVDLPHGFNPVSTDPSAAAGPVYYYLACVTWQLLPMPQCSEVASVGTSSVLGTRFYRSSVRMTLVPGVGVGEKHSIPQDVSTKEAKHITVAPRLTNTTLNHPAIAARLAPDDAATLFALGRASYAVGKHEVGTAEMRQALMLAQNHKQADLAKTIVNELKQPGHKP